MLTPEQVEEFHSLRRQFVKYCGVATQGSTFFKANDLINHAFLHMSTDYKYVKNVRLSAIIEMRREIIHQRMRGEKKPLLSDVFIKPEIDYQDKTNPDNYKGTSLSHVEYDYEQIKKLIDSYKSRDEKAVEIIMLLSEGYKSKDIIEKLNISEHEYKLKYNKIRDFLKKRLSPNQSFRPNIVCSFENTGRSIKRIHYAEKIKEGLKNNKSIIQIGKELGLTRHAIYYHYHRYGNNKTIKD